VASRGKFLFAAAIGYSDSTPVSDAAAGLNWWLETDGSGYTPATEVGGTVIESTSGSAHVPPSRAPVIKRQAHPDVQQPPVEPPAKVETLMLRKRRSRLWWLFAACWVFGYGLLRRRRGRTSVFASTIPAEAGGEARSSPLGAA
jgi:hypothetical protein